MLSIGQPSVLQKCSLFIFNAIFNCSASRSCLEVMTSFCNQMQPKTGLKPQNSLAQQKVTYPTLPVPGARGHQPCKFKNAQQQKSSRYSRYLAIHVLNRDAYQSHELNKVAPQSEHVLQDEALKCSWNTPDTISVMTHHSKSLSLGLRTVVKKCQWKVRPNLFPALVEGSRSLTPLPQRGVTFHSLTALTPKGKKIHVVPPSVSPSPLLYSWNCLGTSTTFNYGMEVPKPLRSLRFQLA